MGLEAIEKKGYKPEDCVDKRCYCRKINKGELRSKENKKYHLICGGETDENEEND